ncbi:AGE family epimerase/isomerase [Inquilinus sp. CAU 1745]|uniref:AGE family epimerase/isomerase n=1 Tax=Inquilinus sp. CAU 1745 TaxID=3140369 RepID=UPI00325B60BD
MTLSLAGLNPAAPADLRAWLMETAMPFWAEAGIDRAHGGFIERLNPDRTQSDDDYKRIRVQGRQIYVFAHAHMMDAPVPALEVAREGFSFLVDRGWDRNRGGFYGRLSRAGEPLDPIKDFYDHAFILHGFAWLHRAGGDGDALDWAHRTMGYIDDAMAEPRWRGYREHATGDAADVPTPRRQNPHMHLLEAVMAMFEATGDSAWLDRADRIVALLERHFFDPDTGTLGEYFTTDWKPAPGGKGAIVEPGHHFEWVWLLHRFAALSGDDRALPIAEALHAFALAHGVDGEPGMVPAAFDEVDRTGAILAGSKRLWPQSEAVKAFLARFERTGDPADRDAALGHLAMMFGPYLAANHGVWRDQLSRDGKEISDYIPSSTLYHLYLCIAETLRVLDR